MLKGDSVQRSFIKALVLAVGLLMSAVACAVSMGGINVTSALGEPLKAEIDLASVSRPEKNKLSARLASPDVFKGAGMDYPDAMPKLKFQVETRANGDLYIKVSTDQAVNEPFVSILVELSWSSGRLLREYTFLLDPRVEKAELPKAAEVKPVLSSVEAAKPTPLEAAKPVPAENAAAAKVAAKDAFPPMRVAAPVDEKVPVVEVHPVTRAELVTPVTTAQLAPPAATAPVSAIKPPETAKVAADTITVKHGDTLGKIAAGLKPSDISLERMLVALYNANVGEFDGRNMNRLRTGKILRVPDSNELNKVAQADADKDIRIQAADWHDYRQKLAQASTFAAQHATRQEFSGKISTVVADKTPPARESAKEVVRLSRGEAPGDKAAAGGNAKALQDKLHSLEEEAVARGKTLKESNEHIAMLEKNIKDMQRLIELKTQSLATAKPEAEKEVAKARPAAPAQGGSGVKAAKPAAAPKVKTSTPAPPSMLDDALDNPLYLAGGAAVLLALGGIGFMLARRGRAAPKIALEKELPEHIIAPIKPSPDTGDFTHTAALAPVAGAAQPEDVDPVSEAELFLNFGRDVQAEEILKDALNNNPNNQRARLKLLTIYANRKDTSKFASNARQIRDSGDAAAWAEAAEMGRMLEPGNSLYGGESSAAAEAAPAQAFLQASIAPVTPAAPAAPAALDFDLDFGALEATSPAGQVESTTAVDIPLEATAGEAASGLDLELGHETMTEAAPSLTGEEAAAKQDVPEETKTEETKVDSVSMLDFDLGLEVPTPPAQEDNSATINPAALQEPQPLLEAAELVLDAAEPPVTPALLAEEAAATVASAVEENNIDFALDFPSEEKPGAEEKPGVAPEQAKVADTMNLGGISLEMEEPSAAPETKDAHWYDVATKLDLARAYQEMGDSSGAREILEEVLNEGDAQQRATAQDMMQQLSV